MLCLTTMVMSVYAAGASSQPSLPGLANHHSGISLKVNGSNGEDYCVEPLYYDALIDDRSVIYIRPATTFGFAHNEHNTYHNTTIAPFKRIGPNGLDATPNSGDEGLIRYKVDRDQQLGLAWSSKTGKTHKPKFVLPAYAAPLSFKTLTFDDRTRVLGAVGPTRGPAGPQRYYRGQRDAFGDEHHTITVADDDAWLAETYYSHKWASDGKVFHFVVAPRTPCLSPTVSTSEAQFYTTPAKTYFLPFIHPQTTYVTDGVDLHLTNITNDGSILYRVDDGPVVKYSGPIGSESLPAGRSVLEYYIEGGPHKKRTIVRNPPFPSAGEKHPSLLWKDDAEFAAIRKRLTREPYKAAYAMLRGRWAAQGKADAILGRGHRDWVAAALTNAFIARIEGVAHKAPGAKASYAAHARKMLLDNKLNIDPVGFEMNHNFDPMPTPEWNTFGYYSVNPVFDAAFAYDLLISFYKRSPKNPGGITPIEDIKIRDQLARWICVNLQDLRGFEGGPVKNQKPDPSAQKGMWDMARLCGAAVAAMAMPTYDTPYYGTAGFDGKKATHPNTPFRTPITWRDIFVRVKVPLSATPGMRRRFNHLDGGLVTRDGQFRDRRGYYSYHLMGHCFQLLANVMKLRGYRTYPYLERSFARANEGTLEGLKINHPDDRGGRQYPQLLLVNPRFGGISAPALKYLRSQLPKLPTGQRNKAHFDFQMYLTKPYGFIFFQDDWE